MLGRLASGASISGRFEIVRVLGEGGMGVVYEARDVERGTRVALKTVLYRDPESVTRFKNEFRALADIHHPNLVALGELVADPTGGAGGAGDVFFTMELVDGVDLLTWVRGASRAPSPSTGKSAHEITRADGVMGAVMDTDRDAADAFEAPPPASRERPSLSPPAGRLDEGRLRDAFKQIALGLCALHDAGKIHRDVKPTNVRVAPDGRVALLDFGLVFDVDARHATETNVVGTPAYMAPEQASSEGVGPETDWYAVGVMLYQCLTGRLPFEGAAMAVLLAKQYQDPPAPSAIAPGVPRDLDQLCVELLQFERAARPTGREILRRLSQRASSKPPGVLPPPPPPASRERAPASAPFVGRAREMDAMKRALADATAEKRAVTIVLHGESGVGKTSLARRFLEHARAEHEALVLTGRCYEREAVPYKAFDEVIDALSRRLARMPKPDALALLPSRVEALAQLFPALGRVPAVAEVAAAVDRDVHERRRAAFRALRELLRKVAARQTLVIAIDDLQWTDADSLSLLAEILRPPDAPPIVLLVTMRGAIDASDPGLPPRLARDIPGDVRAIQVGRLAKDDARELAARLIAREAGVSHADAMTIAREADGHPLFIDELVRHAATRVSHPPPAADDRGLRLDDALWARAERLDLGARRVLEVACVLGAPVAQEVVATAAGLGADDFARAVSLLRTTNFVRTRGARVTDAIEPFHDRVREAVAARLDPDAKRECHARIAAALELAKGSDPEVLATHWGGAGEAAKAASYAIVAAEQAAQALAFERAARLFRAAIEIVPRGDPRLRALREQLGDALANAGACAQAADEYTRAADGASPADALDLRRRAAEQLLRSGQVQRGFDATRAVLAAVGLSLPRSRLGGIVALLWCRLVLRLRGLGFTPRDAKAIAPEDLARVDVCWSVSCTLGYADTISGALFQTRHLLLALRLGEPWRVARALAIEGGFAAIAGQRAMPRATRVLALARDAAKGITDPYLEAVLTACEGLAACFALRFAAGADALERAVATFRERCPGSSWEVTTTRFFLFMAQFYACRFAEMRDAHEAALKDAIDRGDRYAAVMLRVGALNRRWLLAGDPARARRELDEAMRAWPARPFHVMHFHALVADSYTLLYDGDPERAEERLRAARPDVERSLMLLMEGARLEYAGLAARIALSLAARASGAARDAALARAEREARVFERQGAVVSRAAALSIRASIAHARGDRGAALAQLEELAKDDTDDAWLAATCARWVAARMRGGADAGAEAKRAMADLRARGAQPDRRLIAVQFPGLESYV